MSTPPLCGHVTMTSSVVLGSFNWKLGTQQLRSLRFFFTFVRKKSTVLLLKVVAKPMKFCVLATILAAENPFAIYYFFSRKFSAVNSFMVVGIVLAALFEFL